MFNKGDLVRVTYSDPPKWIGMIGVVEDSIRTYSLVKLPDGFEGWWTNINLELLYGV